MNIEELQKDKTITELTINTEINQLVRSGDRKSNINEMGYFGNIWVRSHQFDKIGDSNGGGHRHNFDHVTLLAVGSVKVEVDNKKSKVFHAPTFIVIDKNTRHKFTALTDDVVYYCVFAVRDIDGEVEDIYNVEQNSLSHIPPDTPHYARLTDEDGALEILETLKQEI